MTRIQERMTAAVTVLEMLDRRRAETGDPHLGRAIERALLDSYLADIEWDLFTNPPDLATLNRQPQ